MTAAEKGRMGEDLAAARLEQNGWKILTRNYHCRGGELDIVALKDGILAFVEVRVRRSGGMVSPAESVTPAKRKKIVLAAYAFLEEYSHLQQTTQPRFDLVLIEARGDRAEQWRLEHLCDAFQPQQ